MIYKNLGLGNMAVFRRPTATGKIWVLDADNGFHRIEVVNYNQLKRMLKEPPF